MGVIRMLRRQKNAIVTSQLTMDAAWKNAGQQQEMQCQGTFDVSCSYIQCQAEWWYGRSYILLLNQRLRH